MMLVWTVLQWTMTPVLIWKFGFVGVGLASALISFTGLIVIFIAMQHIKFNFFEQIWRQLFATLVMVVILVQWRNYWGHSFVHFALGIMLGAAVFATLMGVTGFNKLQTELRSLLRK